MSPFQWGVLLENPTSKKWGRSTQFHILAVHSSLPVQGVRRLSALTNPSASIWTCAWGTTVSIAPDRPAPDSQLCGGCRGNRRIFGLNSFDLSVKGAQ